MTLLADWLDFVFKTVLGAIVTYITTKYAITHTERLGKKTIKKIRRRA